MSTAISSRPGIEEQCRSLSFGKRVHLRKVPLDRQLGARQSPRLKGRGCGQPDVEDGDVEGWKKCSHVDLIHMMPQLARSRSRTRPLKKEYRKELWWDCCDRDSLRDRLDTHITRVHGRYKRKGNLQAFNKLRGRLDIHITKVHGRYKRKGK